MIENLRIDLRHALRMLRRTPGTTAVAVATLGLAMGLNGSVFSLINALSFRPLPYADVEQLYELSTRDRERGLQVLVSGPDAEDWRRGSRTLTDLALYEEHTTAVRLDGAAERMSSTRATGNLFSVLGVTPAIGRGLSAEDQRPGAPPVVVIANTLWRDRLAGDPGVLGRTIRIDGVDHEIIGVMRPGFSFLDFAQFWTPISDAELQERSDRRFAAIARLRKGFAPPEMHSELQLVAERLAAEYPASNRGWQPVATALSQANRDGMFTAMIAAVLFVLLIACANLGNLMLARGAARRSEIAVRVMLGASRRRVIAQLLTESAVLAALGVILGAVLTWWGIGLLVWALPVDQLPAWLHFSVDYRVITYFALMLVIAIAGFGLLPALALMRGELATAAREDTRNITSTRSRTRLRNGLILGEVALSLVLLASAAVFVRSGFAVARAEPGYDVDRVLRMQVPLRPQRYPDATAVDVYLERALGSIERVRGASAAAAAGALPPEEFSSAVPRSFGPATASGADRELALEYTAVTPSFFDVLGIRIDRGRGFDARDAAGAGRVVIVSGSAAEALWPGEDPIGRTVKLARAEDDAPWRTVVGVTADRYSIARGRGGPPRRVRQEIFTPAAQGIAGDVALLIRTEQARPELLAGPARTALLAIDADQVIMGVQTEAAVVYSRLRLIRWLSGLALTFAMSALALAAIGLFGVIAFSVTQRTREIGIRMALGARPAEAVRMVVGGGMRVVGAGVALGLLGALVTGDVIAAFVYGAEPREPITLLLVSSALLGVAALASWVPARRAARVDPLAALRSQ